MKFAPGDIVTRGGDDLQRVLTVTDDCHSMEVVCIRAPASGWCKVGDREYNLCRRYDFPNDPLDGEALPDPPLLGVVVIDP